MEDSSKIIGKRTGRLTLSKCKDSPTTSGRIVESAGKFNSPPSFRLNSTIQASYSTPVNHYKRSCHVEESPSQDFDTDPHSIPSSQDIRQSIIDVDWKWDEQSHNTVVKKLTSKPRRVDAINNYHQQRQSKKAILQKSPICDKKKGFFKFQEELLQNLNNAKGGHVDGDVSPLTDGEVEELESSFKENDDDRVSIKLKMSEKCRQKTTLKQIDYDWKESQKRLANMNVNCLSAVDAKQKLFPFESRPNREKTFKEQMKHSKPIGDSLNQNDAPSTSNELNLLEDSDLDNLLLQCSQQVEDCYHDQTKRKRVEKSNDHFGNDSFDDLFLCVDVGGEQLERIQSKLCRSPLIRHKSMPMRSPFSEKIPQNPTNSFIRHKSMPGSEEKKKYEEKILLGASGCSASTESITAGKRQCSAAEIEKKRLEAIQRREASRLRKIAG